MAIENPLIYFGYTLTPYNIKHARILEKSIAQAFISDRLETALQHQAAFEKWERSRGGGMEFMFQDVLPRIDIGVFLAFPDGMLGADIYDQAKFLSERGKGIYEVYDKAAINSLVLDEARRLSLEETLGRIHS